MMLTKSQIQSQSSVLLTFIVLDAVIMALGIFFPISNYNAIFNGVYSVLLLAYLRNNSGYWIFNILSIVFFYIFSNPKLYVVFDGFTSLLVTGLLILFTTYDFTGRDLRKIRLILLFFFILNLLLCISPSYYFYHKIEGIRRFQGIFRSANLSVSVMTIIGVVVWEIEKRISTPARKKILWLNIIALVILMFATRTRTLLFLLPYWAYQSYHFLDRRLFIFVVILAGAIFGQIIYQSLSTRMNLTGDQSTATRASIYEALIRRILKNYVVIPHGSNEAYIYIQKFTKNPEYSSHNDFLRYIYDWGIYFFFFIAYIIRLIKRNVNCNLEFYLIIVAYTPLALHNLLFLPIAWVPFCLILNIKKKIY